MQNTCPFIKMYSVPFVAGRIAGMRGGVFIGAACIWSTGYVLISESGTEGTFSVNNLLSSILKSKPYPVQIKCKYIYNNWHLTSEWIDAEARRRKKNTNQCFKYFVTFISMNLLHQYKGFLSARRQCHSAMNMSKCLNNQPRIRLLTAMASMGS